MKTKSILCILMLFCSITLFAQHPLVGTWEMVSIKGTDIDGKPFDLNNTNMRETKIITPTHYMLIQHTVKGDSVIFSAAHAGTVKFEGNKYIETPTVTSLTTNGTPKTDFTWKVKGDQFIQAGTITMPDGRKIMLDELVFKKVKNASVNPKNPIVGTWNQLSSEFINYDGTIGSHTPPTVTRFWLMTPTHYMLIGHRDNKFEYAYGGSYLVQKDKIVPNVTVASFNITKGTKYNLSYRMNGNKLYTNGTAINAQGKKMTWSDVFEKVGSR